MDAAVPDDFPFFTVQIFDLVGIVATAGMLGTGAKQVGQRMLPPRGLSRSVQFRSQNTGHGNQGAGVSPRSSASMAAMRHPMASITLTVTPFPACL